MSFDETATAAVRYDDDNEPTTQSVTTTTAADLRKLEGDTMDPAPKATRKPAKPTTAPGKAKVGKTEPVKEYAVLDTQTKQYTRVEAENLEAMAREIEGQSHKFLMRLLPLKISINVSITE